MSSEYNKDRAVNLIKAIRELDKLCDVTLVSGIDHEKFPVHRNIMAASSSYFKELLVTNSKERDQKEISLPGIDGPTLRTIIDYSHCRDIEINDENVERMFVAALNTELVELKKACADYWVAKIEVDTCVDVLMVAVKYTYLKELEKKSFAYICKNFDRIASVDMVQLDEKVFERILRSDKITAAEDKVFHVFKQWVQHEELTRSKFVASLAELIRLDHVSPTCLGHDIEPFYVEHGCDKPVKCEYRKRVLNPKPICLRRFSAMCCANLPHNFNPDSDEIEIHEFDEDFGEIAKVKSITLQMKIKNVIFSRDKIFAFGNKREFQSHDLTTSQTETLPEMPFPSNGGVAAIGKFFYLFRGVGSSAAENVGKGNQIGGNSTKFARYDTERKVWQELKSMPIRMSGQFPIELNGSIYVVERNMLAKNLLAFWCYEPTKDEWKEKAGFHIGDDFPHIFKMEQNLCTFSKKGGFKIYDAAMNRWNTLEPLFHGPNEAQNENASYYLTETIDFKDKTYGLLFVSGRLGTHFQVVILEPKSLSCDIIFLNGISVDSMSRVHFFSHNLKLN